MNNTLPRLRVAKGRRHLETSDGTPFFWLADTAWTLTCRLKREDARLYFANRAAKGFTVIQIVAVEPEGDAELRNVYGVKALGDPPDPARPDPKHFEYLDEVIDMAAEHGMYVALVPAWGQMITGDDWFGHTYPRLFNPENAKAFGRWLGERYRACTSLIWVLGGDRHPVHFGEDHRATWRSMAEGIGQGVTGKPLAWDRPDPCWDELVMTYHPTITDDPPAFSSSEWLHDDAWMGFNMLQSGHRDHVRSYEQVHRDYHRTPTKPVLDGEPNYEDWVFRTADGPASHSAWNVRKRAYWSVLAGSCGHTYGHTSIWRMVEESGRSERLAFTWREAMDRPGACQMLHLRRLIESRPFFDSVPDQRMAGILDNYLDIRVQARRGTRGDFAFIYLTSGGDADITLDPLAGPTVEARWYDPRAGRYRDARGNDSAAPAVTLTTKGVHRFAAPTRGREQDWVLVLDSVR